MPELGPYQSNNPEFRRRLKEVEDVIDTPDKNQIVPLLEGDSWSDEGPLLEVLGGGKESIVAALPGGTRVVAIGIEHMSAERAKQIFHLQKIFSTLFPHNFPKFYAASGIDSATNAVPKLSGTIRQEIKISDAEILFSKEEFLRICKQDLGIDFSAEIEEWNWPANFSVGEDGGEYYLDVLTPQVVIPQLDQEKIESYMSKIDLDENLKRKIRNSIAYIQALSSEISAEQPDTVQ